MQASPQLFDKTDVAAPDTDLYKVLDPEGYLDAVACHAPYPPPVTRILCVVHLRSPEHDTLDATPLVGPDAAYCAAIGYTDVRIGAAGAAASD